MSVGTKTAKLVARRCKDKKMKQFISQSWRPGHWHIIQGGLRIDAHMYDTENALSSSTKILKMNSVHVSIRDFQLCTNFLVIMLSEPNIYEYYLHLFMMEIISVNICKSQIETWPGISWIWKQSGSKRDFTKVDYSSRSCPRELKIGHHIEKDMGNPNERLVRLTETPSSQALWGMSWGYCNF